MTLMAEIITAHIPTTTSSTFNRPESGSGRTCRCGLIVDVPHSEMADSDSDVQPYLDRKLAAHLADELAKAGYGLLPNTMREYGAPLMGINGLSGPPVGHGYIRDPNFLTRSTHHRLVTPWQELTKETE